MRSRGPRPSPGRSTASRGRTRSAAPAGRTEERLAAWVEELAQATGPGQRPDLALSHLLRREKPEAGLRRLLVVSLAAWFRWSALLEPGARPAGRLPLLRRLEELAASEAGPPAALREAARRLPGVAAPRLPDWIRRGLPAGVDAAALALACLRPPSLWIRARRPEAPLLRQLEAIPASAEAHPRLPAAWRLECREDLYATTAYRQGAFVLQDPASQAIGILCGAAPGQHWLDLCAGAGGKSLQLADAMAGKGVVEACEVSAARLAELRRRARRLQVFNLRGHAWDGQRLPRLPPADGVLVDAPCSSSGTLRRNPDLWQRPAPALAALTALQDGLLDLAAARVKPGGRLVYATCSLLAVENEERVQAFLARHPAFRPAPLVNPLDGRPGDGRLRLSPLDGDHDGTFTATLWRMMD